MTLTANPVFLTAPVLRDVPASPQLFDGRRGTGGRQWFGHVEVVDSEKPGMVDLWMAHRLLGDDLDEKELGHAMYGVHGAADRLDDELKSRFGGEAMGWTSSYAAWSCTMAPFQPRRPTDTIVLSRDTCSMQKHVTYVVSPMFRISCPR